MTWYCLFIAGCGPSPISQGFLTPATRNFGPGTSYSLPSQCRHRKEQTKSVLWLVHVTCISVCSIQFILHQVHSMRHFLMRQTLVCVLVVCKVDYCNSVLIITYYLLLCSIRFIHIVWRLHWSTDTDWVSSELSYMHCKFFFAAAHLQLDSDCSTRRAMQITVFPKCILLFCSTYVKFLWLRQIMCCGAENVLDFWTSVVIYDIVVNQHT